MTQLGVSGVGWTTISGISPFRVCDDVSSSCVAYDGTASIVNANRGLWLAEYDSKIEKGLARSSSTQWAEYLPAVGGAKSRIMVVTDYRVVSVNLPASTGVQPDASEV